MLPKYDIDFKENFNEVQKLTINYINYISNNFLSHKKEEKIDCIYNCLQIMLNKNIQEYNFYNKKFNNIILDLDDNKFQTLISNINEKQNHRKSFGVYYTPKDVVSFIINNCFNNIINNNIKTIINQMEISKINNNIESLLFEKTVFDPTCGTGEFLVGTLKTKIDIIMKTKNHISDKELLLIINTIYGNDINIESIEIAKIRLFFTIIKYTDNLNIYIKIANILNRNFFNYDFINIKHIKVFDIILGNPPYVEYSKSPIKPNIKYGNIYANVLHNSIDSLKENGVVGFIVPISYISTLRMNAIRKYIENKTSKQFILNYADRPSSLFTTVHQKLSIVIAKLGKNKHRLFTSNYNYWYKYEREKLFNNVKVYENNYKNDFFYPKISNILEDNIFKKIFTNDNNNIFNLQNNNMKHTIYLNMRACFWIKAFSFNPGSKEYKCLFFDEKNRNFILCLLNSSLFFWFWNIISDCWHITLKELKYFKISENNINYDFFNKKYLELEKELEKTKKYVKTKQVEYEYKHKLCKNIIDEIDNELAKTYNITQLEINYIKSYSFKYRMNLGNKK